MKTLTGLVLLVFAVTLAPVSARSEPYSERHRVAFEETLAAPGDLDALFHFAEVAVREGDYEGAIGALERLLLLSQDLPGVRIELGGLYLRIGSHDQARYYAVSALQAPGVDAEARARAEALLALVDARAARHRLNGSVTAAFGYQSNVNSAPAQSSVTVAGEAYELGADERASADGNGFVAAALGYVYDPKLVSGLTVDAALAGSVSRQLEQNDYDFGTAGLAVGPRFELGRAEAGASLWFHGLASVSMLGGALYAVGVGGGVTLTAPLGGGLWTDVVLEVSHQTYEDGDVATSASDQTGLAPRAAVQLRYRVFDQLWVIAGGHGSTVRAAVASEEQLTFGGLGGVSVPFHSPLWSTSRPWSVDVVYELALVRYSEADADVDPDTRREDTDHRVNARLQMPLAERFAVFISGSYADHASNIELYTYSGTSASGGASYTF